MSCLNASKSTFLPQYDGTNRFRQEWNAARTAANEIFSSIASGPIHVAVNNVRRRVETAYSKLQYAESYVESLENGLNIEERWTEASPEYKSFYQENVLTSYERALDELERLVVMRLFELTKMSTSGTGMYFGVGSFKYLVKFEQATGFVVKLEKRFNVVQRQSRTL
jgi:hypothetical protein